jgi:long-chain acyl-CoA synthetase
MVYTDNSVVEIFQRQVKKYGDRACVAWKKDGVYVDISWNGMDAMIRNLGNYLLSIGIRKGDKVALFSPNRYEWWIADQAILSIGAVNVPIYATNSPEEAFYVLDHSDSKVCFVATADHLDRVLRFRSRLKKLNHIVLFDPPAPKKQGIVSLEEAWRKGSLFKDKSLFDKRLKAVRQGDIATIIYTSGTTGNPKGVMLSHLNFVSDVAQLVEDFRRFLTDREVALSFLPLSHSFERTVGYYLAVAVGAKVAFAVDFATILENLVEIRPSIIVSVPRLYEKIHAGILARAAQVKGLKKLLFRMAMKTSTRNLPYICNDLPRKGLFALKYALFDRLVFSRLRYALGLDRIKFALSGGGPLSVSDAEFFLGMGVMVLEGFGLTETTPVTNANRPGEIKPGSVGRPLCDTKNKIADDGELLIRGPEVMAGYYKDAEATRSAFTRDGWFKTGDIGVIDERGRLSITGRIKDIIVTAGGKNISPQNIENSLKGSKYIEQIAVIGDRRKYLSALIIPAFDELGKWAKAKKIPAGDSSELVMNPDVRRLIAREIEQYTRQFSRVEQIRQFTLLNEEWTQGGGELTPTLKVKRMVIERKYAREIARMYSED